jgi:hypothetical protein
MIEFERRALLALEDVSMRLGSGGKRFRNDLLWCMRNNPECKLTPRQASYLWFLVDMYRWQIKDEDLLSFGAHRRLTGELPDIYLEGDLRPPIVRVKKARRVKKEPEHVVAARDAERSLF